MTNWDDLRHLLALHQAGSLARAGELLGVDKATIGRRLDALERSLGATLVQRLPSGYRLTDHGQRALETAREMADAMTTLTADIGGLDQRARGVVRVTAPAWFCRHVLIPALPGFRDANPEVELQFLTTNVVVSMTRREADLAVRNVRSSERGLASRRLGELVSALYGARTYLDRVGRPEQLEAIAALHMISYQDRLTYVEGFAWLEALNAPVAFRASDTLALAEACQAGLGACVLPCYVGDSDPALERIDCAGNNSEAIWLIVPQDIKHRLTIRLTMQWIAGLFADHQHVLSG